jgi:hypothetical protein
LKPRLQRHEVRLHGLQDAATVHTRRMLHEPSAKADITFSVPRLQSPGRDAGPGASHSTIQTPPFTPALTH